MSAPSETSKAKGCKDALLRALKCIQSQHSSSALLLSGGVDTAAILEANALLHESNEGISIPFAVTVLAKDQDATDRPYASSIATRHNLAHHIVERNLEDVLEMLPLCMRTLKTFDGMTLRNSLVIALGMQKAKELGASVVMTGDGADELLGGYSFTWATRDPELWAQKRLQMSKRMQFATPKLAEAFGLQAVSPYLQDSFISWSVSESTLNDCITELPIELHPIDPSTRELHITGKACLRLAFPDSGAAFRRKDPIEVGSGCSAANFDKFFSKQFPSDVFEQEKASFLQEDKVVIRDPEHLYYYKQFKVVFPTGLSEKERFGSDPCCCCGYQLKDAEDLFCYVCGAWPARHLQQASS